ncbi:MAG: release factor glutamine methyltransferase [Betaproteobacteria bacterium]|nr:release factor glutamine methyltransferase [Betaproteobacteria bacterium]
MTDSASVAEAYARGRVHFMGIELAVAPGALVPRAETELLGRTAVETLLAMRLPAPRVVDMCCGTGNLACAIAHHIPHSRVWASDLTDDCVSVACSNVELRRLSERVSVHQGDLFASLAGQGLEASIDVIVCNPPYISEARLEGERAPLLELEPREAFAAGPYGISIHQRVIRDALAFLRPGGALLFEVGLGQERQVKTLFERSRRYEDIRVIQNEAGEGRVVLARSHARSPA